MSSNDFKRVVRNSIVRILDRSSPEGADLDAVARDLLGVHGESPKALWDTLMLVAKDKEIASGLVSGSISASAALSGLTPPTKKKNPVGRPRGIAKKTAVGSGANFTAVGSAVSEPVAAELAPAKACGRPRADETRVQRMAKRVEEFVLANEGTAEAIVRITFGNTPDTSKALRLLREQKKIRRSGFGGRVDPFVYYSIGWSGAEQLDERVN